MHISSVRLKAVPVAVAVLLGGLWSTSQALPVSYGNITLDAAYHLGGTYSGGTPPSGVVDGMADPAANIFSTPAGADVLLFSSDSSGNNAFFHTYGFTGAYTYFGARASGVGDFYASTRATFSQTFTNTSSSAQLFNFSFNIANGELGISGQGAGFADLLLNIKRNGSTVARSRTTITQTSGGAVSCDDSSSDQGSLTNYMNCASPNGAFATDLGGPFAVNMGLVGAGESFVLDYDIIATVSGNLSQGTRLEERCTGGYGGYGDVATLLSVIDSNSYGGGGGGQTCEFVPVPVLGEAIARTGDPFGAPIFFNNVVVNDPGSASFQGSFNDVPEPGSIALVGLGLAGLAAMRRNRREPPQT